MDEKRDNGFVPVVVVDDHPILAEGIRLLIQEERDCGALWSRRGAVCGLGVGERLRPRLAIVDISLKRGVSGIELIKMFKEKYPTLLVLVLSMHEERHIVERAFKAGADGYILKDEVSEAIVKAIRSVLSGIRYLSPDLVVGLHASGARGCWGDYLSDRELEVFALIGQGRETREIAESLFISVKTVETYRQRLKEKLGITSNTELIRNAVQRFQE